MVTPPPLATARPPSEPNTGSRRKPADVVATDASPVGRSFETSAGFLISATLHLILLLLLALFVRPQRAIPPVALTMASSSGEETQEFQFFDLSMTDSPLEETPSDIAALKEEVLTSFAEDAFDPTKQAIMEATSIAAQSGQASRPSDKERKPDVTFFGTHGYGSRFVFVLDVSGSMLSGNGGRMRRARQELVRAIHELKPDHHFYVVMYSNYTIKMFGPKEPVHMIQATSANKRRAAKWVGVVSPRGGTMPGHALRIAGELKPDAVFFLSDGEFLYEEPADNAIDKFLNGFGQARPSPFRPALPSGVPYPETVLRHYSPEIVVHTVALESETSRFLMARIAREKNGQHQFIPAPRRPTLVRRRQPAR